MRQFFAAFKTPVPRIAIILCLAIIGLNLTDAFVTLRHLEHGAIELNPFMGVLIQTSPILFVMVKHFMALFGLTGICYSYIRWPNASGPVFSLLTLFGLYAILAIYQISLFATII